MSRELEFFFDFASPYAYLAHVRLPDIARRHGCSISYRPVDLPEVKRACGNIGPSTHFLPARQRYIRQDTARWAKRYGVPIAQPSNFDSSRLNRGAFLAIGRGVATEYVDAVGRRVWAEGGAMNDEALLTKVAQDMGWEPKEFLVYTTSEAAGACHRAAVEAARERGVFGVPTMVADGQLWWGNDRLQFVESCLAALKGTTRHG
jgi:2-hydroxychromene-2-carboxylate isomerase